MILYNGKVEVERDKKHRYWVKPVDSDQEPEWYPGVTTILDKLDKSGPLIWWAINCVIEFIRTYLLDILFGKKELDEVTIESILEEAKYAHIREKNTAASIGTVAHNWIEKYIKGKNPKKPKNKEANKAIDAYLKWESEHDIEYLETERPIVHILYKYAGTLDCIAKIDGELGILDFKTSSGIYVSHIWQLAAYVEAYTLETDSRPTNNWIIKISKKDGEFEALKAPEKLWPDFEAFTGLLTAYKREKDLKEWMKNGHKEGN